MDKLLTKDELGNINMYQAQRRKSPVPADAWLYVAEIDRLLGHIRLLSAALADAECDRRAVRELYHLPHEGDFYEQMADHLEDDVVGEVRLQNTVWNLLTETFYEEGIKNNGVAVRFLMRLHLLALEAKLPEYSKDNPVVAEALAELGDPATNSPESLAAAGRRIARRSATQEQS